MDRERAEMETIDTPVQNKPATETQQRFLQLRQQLNQNILGQHALVDRLLIAMLCGGHLLVEGAPGLAKTTAIKTLAAAIDASFQRIQFTPDLLPSDLTGTDIYRPQDASFEFQPGPLFHNLILADEINRAPAKVQSALLEAMGEHHITVGKQTYRLPHLFMVMATQNPIEQEGTYPLPEAQLDRFLLHVCIDHPDEKFEKQILKKVREQRQAQFKQETSSPSISLTEKDIQQAKQAVEQVYLSPALESYLIRIITSTRQPEKTNTQHKRWLAYGASPRATIGLDHACRAHAWLSGRDFVIPEDIQQLAFDILRHRLVLSFEAHAEGVTAQRIIEDCLKALPTP